MKTVQKRIVIYAKDIKNITGRKETATRDLITKIRKKYNKEKGSCITIFEFCEYMGIKPENISGYLN